MSYNLQELVDRIKEKNKGFAVLYFAVCSVSGCEGPPSYMTNDKDEPSLFCESCARKAATMGLSLRNAYA